MSKVLVDRELKPCPFCGGECDATGWLRGDGVRGPECEGCGATAASVEAWNRRAQPAEAEGVQPWRERIIATHPKSEPGYWPDELLVAYMQPEIEELRAALSAVTAERDKIKADRKACWEEFKALVKSSCEKESYLQGEIDQLRAEVEGLREAFGECIQSLHDEMLQSYGGQKPDDMHPVTRRNYDRDMAEIAEYRAAMAAKEAESLPACSGCGVKGWTGNCDQCIPY